jgi:ketosteroid isomerase-like protein
MGQAADVVNKKFEMFNAQDAGKVRGLLAAEVEWAAPGALCRGPDQVIELFSVFWEAFPDLRISINRLVEDGSTVITDARAEGTHLGTLHTPGGDIPPSDKHMKLPYLERFEVKGGLIVSGNLIFDRVDMLQQLGAMPVPASA